MSESLSARLRQAFAGHTYARDRWFVVTDPQTQGRVLSDAETGRAIASWISNPNDARLIAAAPELLELLAEAVEISVTSVASRDRAGENEWLARVRELVEREHG